MNNFQDSLPYILNITYDPIVLHKIHGFPDGSLEARGSCVYLKTIGKTIPERSEILLLSWSFFALKKPLHPFITECETLYWIDSSVCLSWIKNAKGELKMLFNIGSMQFVEILEWHFCKTIDNLADYVTRQHKLPSEFFISTAWPKEPKFLQERHFARFSNWFICWKRSSQGIKNCLDSVIKRSPFYQMLIIWANVQNFFMQLQGWNGLERI